MSAARAEVRLRFESEDAARWMAASIGPENGRHVRARVEGHVLVLEAEAAAPLSLLHTLDDVLACLSAAQRAGRQAGQI